MASPAPTTPALRSAKLDVCLRPPDVDELDRRAQESGRTRSEVIREALVRGLAAEGVRAATRVPRRLEARDLLERHVNVKLTAPDAALLRQHLNCEGSAAAVVRQCVRRELEKPSPGRLPVKRSREPVVDRVAVTLTAVDLARIRERLRGRSSIAGFIRRCIRLHLGG